MHYFVLTATGKVNQQNSAALLVKMWLVCRQKADFLKLADKIVGPGRMHLISSVSTPGDSPDEIILLAKNSGCDALAELVGWNDDGLPRWKSIGSEPTVDVLLN